MKTTKPKLNAILMLSFIIFLLPQLFFAQEQFRLSDYKNPDYKWKQLDLGFALGGNNGLIKTGIQDGASVNQNFNQLNSGLDMNYYATKNSEFYQGYQNFRLSGDFNVNRTKTASDAYDLESTQKNGNQNFNLGAKTINRFYNRKTQFIEADLDLTGRLYNSVFQVSDSWETLPYQTKSTDLEYSVSASLPVLVGLGRIEEVQDARLAVYILDDLAKAGDLKREANRDEILAFSQFITQTKNERFFDSRIRKIAEITAIDSFLTVLDLKAQSGASYYTLLNDNWDNANGPVRRTGGRFSIGLVPDIELIYNASEDFFKDTLNDPEIMESFSYKNTTQTNSWGLDFMTGYTWEKPVNLYWQHSVNAQLAYSLYHQRMKDKYFEMDSLANFTESRLNNPNLRLNAGYMIGFYPNSRTNLNLGVNTSFNQYWGDEQIGDEPETDEGRILIDNTLYLSCYYYISPQVRLSVNFSSDYIFTKVNQQYPDSALGDVTRHQLQNSIYASLTYSIF